MCYNKPSKNMVRLRRIAYIFLFILLVYPMKQADAKTANSVFGPSGSHAFGENVWVLPNGNIVVADPGYSKNGLEAVGAVYLYDGRTLDLISVIIGKESQDRIGSDGIIILKNGNFLIRSSHWSNGLSSNIGAITWVSATKGVNGFVSSENSLIGGSYPDSYVGSGPILALDNGAFVAVNPLWTEVPNYASHVGAITWGNGITSITGTISRENSLIGVPGGNIGSGGIISLPNGNYIVYSPGYGKFDEGAVTWGNKNYPITGIISTSNSLLGTQTAESVGSGGITILPNSNYLVGTPGWDGIFGDQGAITWGDGEKGITGTISEENSLIGSSINDSVGSSDSVVILKNGNYVVNSLKWDHGNIEDVGSITLGSGGNGLSGKISVSNSIIGSNKNDMVGSGGITVLSNGSFVINSPLWNSGVISDTGAVTWHSGLGSTNGFISSSNSLVGSSAGDLLGSNLTVALDNGNFVIVSPMWDNGSNANAGSITWGDGNVGVSGIISSNNSLIGTNIDDRLGSNGVKLLKNGNYIISSPLWDNDRIVNVGAVTWGRSMSIITGTISESNSLIGSSDNDEIGYIPNISGEYAITELENGNYVVNSPLWDDKGIQDVGAVTWGDGLSGVRGKVSVDNSIIGASEQDRIGRNIETQNLNSEVITNGITTLKNGNYIISSSLWDNGSIKDAGAITWGNGTYGSHGVVSDRISLIGSSYQDEVSGKGVVALNNGNYVVCSPLWDDGSKADVGAITWEDGTKIISGTISSVNSLVGGTPGDQLGSLSAEENTLAGCGVTALANGNYIVASPLWDNGTVVDAGAITWSNGTTGITGTISMENSLVGTTELDKLGSKGATVIKDSSYIVVSPLWDNGIVVDAGFVIWSDGMAPLVGNVSDPQIVLGQRAYGGNVFTPILYDSVYDHLIIGKADEQRVIIIGNIIQPINKLYFPLVMG